MSLAEAGQLILPDDNNIETQLLPLNTNSWLWAMNDDGFPAGRQAYCAGSFCIGEHYERRFDCVVIQIYRPPPPVVAEGFGKRSLDPEVVRRGYRYLLRRIESSVRVRINHVTVGLVINNSHTRHLIDICCLSPIRIESRLLKVSDKLLSGIYADNGDLVATQTHDRVAGDHSDHQSNRKQFEDGETRRTFSHERAFHLARKRTPNSALAVFRSGYTRTHTIIQF